MPTEPTRRTVLALMGSLAPAMALAAYPDRPIKLVVALAPGGPADTAARVFAPYLAEQLGQNVVIENRTGASSVIGTESVVRSAADGYTLLFGSSSSFAVNPAVMKNLRFEVQKDLKLVGLVSHTPHVLVVRASLAANSPADLVALAKSRPKQLNFSSPGVGSANHLAGELFKTLAGIDAVHVPYKGIPEAMTAVVSGDIQFNFSPVVNILPLSRNGKLLALAASTGKRSSTLPDLPTVAEAGVPGYVFDPWFGILAPAKTPKPLLARLSSEIARIVELPDVRERLRALGADPAPTSPEGFDAHIRAEVAKFQKIVRDAGIKPE